MTPSGKLKLVSQLLDLPIVDSEGNYSGVVDDVELDGGPGKPTRLAALLVGPGAYRGRLPRWAMGIVRLVAGDRITRVPVDRVKSIDSAVHLNGTGDSAGLHKSEDRARRWIPRAGAM
jgi:sporulation protein YlmC with PRC-barrel domain